MFTKLVIGIMGLLPIASCQTASAENRWLYQLQDAEPAVIADSPYNMVVIDPTRTGTDNTRYSKSEIASIQQNGTTVLAYISIGEASAFRSYWKKAWGKQTDGVLRVSSSAPVWLGRTPNPEWPESVKVRYWEEEWWTILKTRLDLIQKAGFDGVYLDIVDAYAYWGNESTYESESFRQGDPKSREEAALRMIELVERIADYTRNAQSSFQVFPQNAEGIFRYDEDESYLDTINGIGTEDLWFNEDKRVDKEEVRYRLSYLKQVHQAGKTVLSVDYVRKDSPTAADRQRMEDYYSLCAQQGFSCFAANMDRELDVFIPPDK